MDSGLAVIRLLVVLYNDPTLLRDTVTCVNRLLDFIEKTDQQTIDQLTMRLNNATAKLQAALPKEK